MLIAIGIAIAEEILGARITKVLHRSASSASSASFELQIFLRLWQEVSQKAEKLLAKVEENSEAQTCRTS